MKLGKGILAGLILAAMQTAVFASSVGVSVWDADLNGTIKSGGTEINLKNDLGIGGEKVTEFRTDLNLLGPKGYVHYYKADNSGSKNVNVPITYNGQTYSVGTLVNSQVEQTVIDVGGAKSLVKNHAVQVDLLGGLRYMELNANLTGGSVSTGDSVKAIIPTIGVGAQSHISNGLLAKASISGLDISVDGKKVDTYDIKYGLEYKPVANVAVGVGVQKSKLLAEDGTEKGDLRRDGNYFEVVVKF